MQTFELKLTDMANGGAALGRNAGDQVVFVPLAIPGEQVQVEIVEDKGRYVRARLIEVLEPSPERANPLCPHYGSCGGCHFQHMNYQAQLHYKAAVIRDQLARIGGLDEVNVRPTLANPEPWAYAVNMWLYPTDNGRLGFWSPVLGRVMQIDTCHIVRRQLLDLFQDLDLELPNLHAINLRVGEDGSLLAALETDDLEPPNLETDFPVSVALMLPEGTAANLVGDNYIVQSVKGIDFQISAGSFFYPSPPAIELLVDTMLSYVAQGNSNTLVELYSGVGTLTAFLATVVDELIAVEINSDAAGDLAVNLSSTNNVTLYEGFVEEILPLLDLHPDTMVVDPPKEGLPRTIIDEITRKGPQDLIYVSSDAATLARDGRRLTAQGYYPLEVQPIDMYPQTFQTVSISRWRIS